MWLFFRGPFIATCTVQLVCVVKQLELRFHSIAISHLKLGTCFVFIDGCPRLYQLECLKIDGERVRIIQKIGIAWQRVALSLGFDHSVLDTIQYDHPHRTEAACTEMLKRWLNREACEAITWQRLLEALEDAEHSELAKKLKQWLI